MIVYQELKDTFIRDVNSYSIEDKIHQKFQERLGRRTSDSEVASWMNSMNYMRDLLSDQDIPDDCGVAIEYQIPPTSKRIDFILSGYDTDKKGTAVLVELKQWSAAKKTTKDAIVSTYVGGGVREVSHPSYQVWAYAALIRDFNEYVYTNNINIWPCAYLHNFPESEPTLRDDFYREHLERAPIFLRKDASKLREFIKQFVKYGDCGETLFNIENGNIKPSKSLADHMVSLLQGNREFIMIDEQKLVYESVLERTGSERNKSVVIVDGGPGTGKSVVAINLLVELLNRGKNTNYVTRNAAPRAVYEAKLKGDFKKNHISNLFKGSGSYTESLSNVFDALIVDEAHRLNERSGMFKNMGENQIKEIINSSKCAVFFLDEDQKIHIDDIGDKEQIEHWANFYSADIKHLRLESQFRCNGSDGYISWLDNVLQIRQTANDSIDELGYDFQVFTDPEELRRAIIKKNDESHNNARMLAGYCWDWQSKKDASKFDIEFPEHDFQMKWNLSDDGMLWIATESSINEVGCIHTCQGLELDYVGVIVGDDMVCRDGELFTDATNRSKNDRTVFGYKKLLKNSPADAVELGERIVKNTYRTLMTRGMKGCYIYCVDDELADYFKKQVAK